MRYRAILFLITTSASIALLGSVRADEAPAAPPTTFPTTQRTVGPVQPGDDSSIRLHAYDVTIHGSTVRYEPNPHKNTVGFWSHKEDWVSWEFEVKKAGKYAVSIVQGCGKGSGGAEVEFAVGDQAVKIAVEDTGGFQNWVTREIGTFDLPAGVHTLTVKPQTKPGVAVMDLRSVTLTPTGAATQPAMPTSRPAGN